MRMNHFIQLYVWIKGTSLKYSILYVGVDNRFQTTTVKKNNKHLSILDLALYSYISACKFSLYEANLTSRKAVKLFCGFYLLGLLSFKTVCVRFQFKYLLKCLFIKIGRFFVHENIVW